jgi:O-antigen ligase
VSSSARSSYSQPLHPALLWGGSVLIFATAVLMSHSRAAEIPFTLAALSAPFLAWLHGRAFWQHPAARLLLLAFACYWVPMLLALPDAVNFDKSLSQSLAAIRFPLAGLSFLWCVRQGRQLALIYRLLAYLVVIWCLDAWIQQFFGFNVLGMADSYPRLSGVFANDYLRLGLYSALLLPFLLHQFHSQDSNIHAGSGSLESSPDVSGSEARGRWLRIGVALANLMVLGLIWVSGTRSGWIAAALVVVVWLWSLRRQILASRRQQVLALSSVLLGIAVLLASSLWVPSVQQRWQQSVTILTGDTEALNAALSFRLPIWQQAWQMAKDFPINGVGPRGFRTVYRQRATDDDYFVAKEGIGASHAHQLQLGIVTETGFIGLLGFILGTAVLWRSWHQIPTERRCIAAPPALALLAVVFPMNSHLDAYASSAALMFWWLLSLYVVAWSIAVHSPTASAESAPD